MKLTVDVTRKAITTGRPENGRQCAVAKAMRTAGFREVTVGDSAIMGNYKGRFYSFDTPKNVGRFIERFDATKGDPTARKALKPFSFTLRLAL